MWILLAFGSALFSGATSVLAKCGIRRTDSDVATALRTTVVLVFAWAMVFLTGAQRQIPTLSIKTLVFLGLSGLATGGSWLCYFRALQLGDVTQVVPIDKSSVVLTVLLAWLLLGETMSWGKILGVAGIGIGTWRMTAGRPGTPKSKAPRGKGWMFYAALSAVFASLTAILGKVGIAGVDSNLGTALRTCVVLMVAWAVVARRGKLAEVRKIERRELLFLVLSGIATGAAWLCYYRALRDGPAGVVVPIDKLSILVTVAISRLALRERLTRRAGIGLALITAGTLAMLLPW